jgi:Lrp/AsnC family transcriptional regulator for asnA, asnC and gidA
MALVAVRTSGASGPVADEIATWPEASYVIVTAGQYDLLVELVCDDKRALLDVTNRMRELDGVASTEAFLYLEMVKQLYNWGTRVHEEATT